MRYYDIAIYQTQGASTPVALQTPAGSSQAWWQSHPKGVFNPAALDVEFDLYVGPYATPLGNSFIRIWGIDLPTLKTAVQFAGNPFGKPPIAPMWLQIKGGMQAGLPLANPKQAGLLTAGLVWQSYGNWRGTDMTLDLLLNAGGASLNRPVNLVLNWQKGQALSQALKTCLSTAFPGMPVTISISANLVATATEMHVANSLTGLAQYLSSITQSMQGQGSLGVQIVANPAGIYVFDGTVPKTPKQIVFTDLIGQPTWQGAYELWIQTVMRADINVGDTVAMPPQLPALGPYVLTQPQSYPAYRNSSAIQGNFLVTQARHTGRFRSPDGAQWSSTFLCVPVSAPA